MTEQYDVTAFTNMVAGHLARMPILARVVNRTDEAILCETKGGQSFMVLVTGPGETRQPATATKGKRAP